MRLLAAGGALSLLMLLALGSPTREALAACSGPTGYAGDQIYNSTSKVMQYCNGAKWIPMWGNSLGEQTPKNKKPKPRACGAWTQSGMGSRGWGSVSVSDDGQYIVATEGDDFHLSTTSGTSASVIGGMGGSIHSAYITKDATRALSNAGAKIIGLTGLGTANTKADVLASAGTFTKIARSGMTFAATKSAGGNTYVSLNNGQTWTKRGTLGFSQDITVSSNGGKLMAINTAAGFIQQSDDGGSTWSNVTAAGSRAWKAIHGSADMMHVIASTASEVMITKDGGATWAAATGAPGGMLKLAGSEDGFYLMGLYNTDVYLSDDGGDTWTMSYDGSNNNIFLSSSSTGNKLAIAQTSNHLRTLTCTGGGEDGTSGGGGGTKLFSTDTYTGTAAARSITNTVDTTGGALTIIKRRTAGTGDFFAFDTARGPENRLFLNTDDTAYSLLNSLTGFNTDGFGLGSNTHVNASSGTNYVAWTFKKAPKFFDVIQYTGNGSASQTISHNLGVAPGLILIKEKDEVSPWLGWHRSEPTKHHLFNENGASTASPANIVTPISTSGFSVSNGNFAAGDNANENGKIYIAYVFAHDPSGVMQCGTYTGNGNSNGPTVNLGWEPEFLMIKDVNSAGNNSEWTFVDSKRTHALALRNLGEGSMAVTWADWVLPNGFKVADSSNVVNYNGDLFYYCAIKKGATSGGGGGGGGGGEACETGPIGSTCSDGSIFVSEQGNYRLFAKDADTPTNYAWKNTTTNTPGTSSNTDGKANTDAMIAAGAAAHPAAQACRDFGADWYLPAVDELNALTLTRSTNGGGINFTTAGIASNYYLSSTQDTASTAWSVMMTSGANTAFNKAGAQKIRCFRRTEIPSNTDCEKGAPGTVCSSDGAIYVGKLKDRRLYIRSANTVSSLSWRTTMADTPGTSSVGDGVANTDAMIAAGAAAHPAAQACRAFGSEWYFPAKSEMKLIAYSNINYASAGLTSTYYWSSLQETSSTSFAVIPTTGVENGYNKTGPMPIRCFRQGDAVGGGESNALMERGKISTGAYTSCAIGTDGKAYCWGYNARGTVGDNTTTTRATPVEVSSEDVSNSYKLIETDYQTCAIHTNNSTYCWGGLNNYGELGNNATGVTSHKPVLVQNGGSPGTFTSLSVSAYTACGLATDNKVYCWGLTWGMGSPGGSSAVPRVVSNGANAAGTYKYLGSTSTASHCAIGTDNKAYCWGYNSSGQLGNNTTTQTAGGPPTLVLNGASPGTFKKIATGQGHTCAIGTDDKAYCWGSDSSGQLGTPGPAANSLIPVLVDNGAGPGTYKEITAGELHTCAIATDNKAYCWGGGSPGTLGNGTNADSPTPIAVLNGESPGGFRTIESSSGYTVCGIANDNKAYCWGVGGNYSIGDGNNIDRNVPTKVANGASSGFFGDGAGTGSVDITAEERCDNAEGDFVGNACWFLGGNGRSCKKVCEDNFGLYDDTTLTYAGSGGNAANCQAVMTALGAAGTTAANASNAHGCYLSGSLRYRGTLATTELSATAGVQRACACKVGGDDLGNHTATKDINMNNNRIINVGTPSAGTDIATKAYIDGRTGTNETDPKIGAVTADKWCLAESGAVNCNKNPFSYNGSGLGACKMTPQRSGTMATDGTYIFIKSGATSAHSFNGSTYTQLASVGGTGEAIEYANGKIFTASAASTLAAYSFNGTAFTALGTISTGSDTIRAIWANATHVFVAAGPKLIAYTHSGSTFTKVGEYASFSANPISIWGRGTASPWTIFVREGPGGSGVRAFSYNGSTFTAGGTYYGCGGVAESRAVNGDANYIYASCNSNGLYALSYNGTSFSYHGKYNIGTVWNSWVAGNGDIWTAGDPGVSHVTFNGTSFSEINAYTALGDTGNIIAVNGYVHAQSYLSGSYETIEVSTKACGGGNGPGDSVGNIETPFTVVATREKTQGSSAGLATGMTPGTWYDYPLNRLRQNSLEIIMTDGGIRLPAGKYYVDAVVPFARNGSAKARLYNSSAGAVLATGTPSYNGSGVVPPMMGHITYSYVRGIFTLSSTATIKLQTVLISGTPSTDPTPFGMPNAAGPETYGILKIEKIN